MKDADWDKKFGTRHQFQLTNEERKYFGLNMLQQEWETQVFYKKTSLYYTRVTVYFEGNVIVKTIHEQGKITDDGIMISGSYMESDTWLQTIDKTQLLPLTKRGKIKKVMPSSIEAVLPFGCRFAIIFDIRDNGDTRIFVDNPRANKKFPIGERERYATIRTEEDFHEFARYYMDSCPPDYFEKVQEFRSAQKVTIKYKVGDIFRMDYDRTHYAYGIITGELKKILTMSELPEEHSLRHMMTVPIMVRKYQMITEDPNLKADDLRKYLLGRLEVCSDNDIIWGTHTIVDHRELEPEDIEFHFVCTKRLFKNPHHTLFTQDFLLDQGFMRKPQEFELYIEWGFAQTKLAYDQISDKLKEFLESYSSPHGGVASSIDPSDVILTDKSRQYYYYRNNLLIPENREILNEIFCCLGMELDSTFDMFAEKFGGLTRQEIIERMPKRGK